VQSNDLLTQVEERAANGFTHYPALHVYGTSNQNGEFPFEELKRIK
jgi:hypothetical protein